MKFPGRIYQGEKGTYLAIYNHYPDVWMACPNSIRGSERLAHVSYGWDKNRRAIDLFRLNGQSEISELKLQPDITLGNLDVAEVACRQEVDYQLSPNTPQELVTLINIDIQEFVRTKDKTPSGKKEIGTHSRSVEEFIPETKIVYMQPFNGHILTPGKQEFIKQCGNNANIDYLKGCETSLVPAIPGGLSGIDWAEGIARGFFIAPWNECSYCYAQAKHKSPFKSFYAIDWDKLKAELFGEACLVTGSNKKYGRPVERLRFGKRTEAASFLTRPQFMKTLEICVDTGTQGVIPTKALEFDGAVAALLRRTNSNVLYSSGWDEHELGAVHLGFTNEWRLEQAAQYGAVGVNTAVYFMIANPCKEPTQRDKDLIGKLEGIKNHLVGVQLLPMRYKSKDLAERIAGLNWNDARNDMGLLSDQDPDIGCFDVEAGELRPVEIHPFWLQLIADNNGFYRMCHHTNEHVWCGGCFTRDGFDIEHKRVAVNAVKRKPRPPERTRKKKIAAVKENQRDLFEDG